MNKRDAALHKVKNPWNGTRSRNTVWDNVHVIELRAKARGKGISTVTLGGIKPGDLVLADVRGDRFHAEVLGPGAKRELEVKPLANGRGPLRYLRAREIVRHWRLAGRRNGGSS